MRRAVAGVVTPKKKLVLLLPLPFLNLFQMIVYHGFTLEHAKTMINANSKPPIFHAIGLQLIQGTLTPICKLSGIKDVNVKMQTVPLAEEAVAAAVAAGAVEALATNEVAVDEDSLVPNVYVHPCFTPIGHVNVKIATSAIHRQISKLN